jgi:hypothetical protein
MGQTADSYRYLPNVYFLDMLDAALSRNPGAEVIVYSESKAAEGFDVFRDRQYSVRLDSSLADVWSGLIGASEVILSRSSFSYVPALFASGLVRYAPFWHKPHFAWYTVQYSLALNVHGIAAQVEDMQVPPAMLETFLPCDGFSAPETHVCRLSKDTTIFPEHFPHTLQTLLPCWHWFISRRASNCAFLVESSISVPSWAQSLISHMGCISVLKAPTRCAAIGSWTGELRVEPGDVYDWGTTARDMLLLRKSIMQRLRAPAPLPSTKVGLLQRAKNRRLIFLPAVASGNSTTPPSTTVQQLQSVVSTVFASSTPVDEVLFGATSMEDQALWIDAHDIVLAPHGAAVSNVIFLRPCSVFVQFYPLHYYPFGFFEPLISVVGGIPITWYPGKDFTLTGDKEKLQSAEATAKFKDNQEQRGSLRAADIRVSAQVLKDVLTLAKTRHVACTQKLAP